MSLTGSERERAGRKKLLTGTDEATAAPQGQGQGQGQSKQKKKTKKPRVQWSDGNH
jgi:hypothetical protein